MVIGSEEVGDVQEDVHDHVLDEGDLRPTCRWLCPFQYFGNWN